MILPLVLLVAQSSRPSFPAHWIDGTSKDEPAVQVHPIDDDFFILRQSLRTDAEAPFLYFISGSEKALLIDSGAGKIDIAEIVSGLLKKRTPRRKLVVAHSHSHGDHTAGDAALAKLPDTTVVRHSPKQVAEFFGLADWPKQAATFDLGGRILDVIAIPGHEPAHLAYYDRKTGILLTGDTLYPGRLYIPDFETYLASVERLVAFAESHPVSAVLGTHIEMKATPKEDFPTSARARTDEHVLQLERRHLVELRDRLKAMKDKPRREAADDFIIYPIPPRGPK